MFDFLTDIDTQLFLFLNSLHIPYFDCFMKTFSGKFIWIPMYASILYIFFRRYQWKAASCFTIAICLVILCTDQLCASIIRPIFERLRPSNIDNPISSLVHIVNGYRGGRYGFVSSHAANTFAAALFLINIFRNRFFTLAILLWAVLVSYSRLYLGVHFPGDILCGALLGILVGILVYRIYERVRGAMYRRLQPTSVPDSICMRGSYACYYALYIVLMFGVVAVVAL